MRPFTSDGRDESTAVETSEATASAPAGLTIAAPVVVEQAIDERALVVAAGTGRLAAVLWDMDGTLLDSEKLWAIALEQTAAELGGVISTEARASMVGSNMSNSMGILLTDLGLAVTEDSVAAAGARVAELTTELFRTDLLWRPGAQEALHAVRDAGVPMALVTSTVRSIGEVALETIGADLFDVAVFGDEVPHNKPHPAPYLQAARALGVDPADTVAIEDSPVGVASAVAAGATVLAVPCEVPVEAGERRVLRSSLVGIDLPFLAGLLAPQAGGSATVG